jgi:hypothetical protein
VVCHQVVFRDFGTVGRQFLNDKNATEMDGPEFRESFASSFCWKPNFRSGIWPKTLKFLNKSAFLFMLIRANRASFLRFRSCMHKMWNALLSRGQGTI